MIPSQTDIVLRLAELSRLLDAATVEVAVLDEEAVRAKQAHEVASARAYLTSEGSIEARKAEAVLKCADLALAAELASAKHRACRERIRTLGVQIEVGRSLSAAVRSQFAAEPVGQFT
jgi:hypothetical protein